jgi:hypothetical protein
MLKLRGHFGDWLKLPNGWKVRVLPERALRYELTIDRGPPIALKPEGIDIPVAETPECQQTNLG